MASRTCRWRPCQIWRGRTAAIAGRRLTVLLATVAAFASARPNAVAGTIRHDVADSQYTQLAADPQYAAVGAIPFLGLTVGGTMISSRWVLTAAHVVSTNQTFTPDGGSPVSITQSVTHPNWANNIGVGFDLALMRLDTPITTITPAVRYAGAAPVGMTATIVGYGNTGNGQTGANIAGATRRAGNNILDVIGSTSGVSGINDNYLLGDFDNPSNSADSHWNNPNDPLPLEYMLAVGDSGGGVFVNVNGAPRLAAVNSFVGAFDTMADSDYGDFFGVMQVTVANDWIDDTIAAAWNNAAGGSAQTAANWQIGNAANTLLPDSTDILGFNLAGTYTVNFGGANAYSKILARKGTVTLNLGGATQTTNSLMQNGSVTVGRSNLDVANLTVTGGTLASTDAVIGRSAGSTGAVTLAGAGTQWTLSDSLYIGGGRSASGGNGSMVVDAGTSLQVANILKIWSAGTLNINGGAVTVAKLQLSNGLVTGSGGTLTAGSIEGAGTVNFNVQTSGVISPGFSAGTLTFSQGLALQSGASLVSELGGTTAGATYDVVNVTGTLQVDGLLQLKFLGGFESSVSAGDVFTIVNGSTAITGTFTNAPNNVRIATVDGKGSFVVHYGAGSSFAPDDLVLSNFLATMPGDFDADGDVDGADFVVWQTNFPSTSGHYLGTGDADADGDVDGADFVAWQTHFPTAIASQGIAAVPEPAGWLLGLISLAALISTRRANATAWC